MRARFVLLTSITLVALSGAFVTLSEPAEQKGGNATLAAGSSLAVLDDESSRIQQMFSHQPTYSRPAPRVWSSRLEIRWTARWQSAPRYAV